MTDVNVKINRKRDQITRLQEQKTRQEGAYYATLEKMEEQFGCKTIKQAENKLKKLNKELDELEEELETSLEHFEQEYQLQ